MAMAIPPQQPGKRSLFKEKIIVCKEGIGEVQRDCFINFCTGNILTGPTQGDFARLHKLAGSELARECEKFVGACPTSARVTPSFGAINFKFIVHAIVPVPLDLSRMIDIKKVYLCVRNALDLAMEEGARTIGFPSYFPGLSCRVSSELILRIFTVWVHRNPYAEQLRELKIFCPQEEEFNYFVQAARSLYEEANIIGHMFVPAFVQQRQAYYQRANRTRRYRRLYDPPPENAPQVKLELSAKLAPTLLVLDDENGMKRQFRLTNRSRDGRKMYFRCSRCDTLIKKDGVQIRAKLIVEDGQIVSERFPRHHPECEGKPLEQVLVQQVDRTSRREVRDGYLLPQDAYKKALDRMRFEAAQLGIPVEECFPEWPKLRQQYCRIRKLAVRQQQQERWEQMMAQRGMGVVGEREWVEEFGGKLPYVEGGAGPMEMFVYQAPRKRGRPRKDEQHLEETLLLSNPMMPYDESELVFGFENEQQDYGKQLGVEQEGAKPRADGRVKTNSRLPRSVALGGVEDMDMDINVDEADGEHRQMDEMVIRHEEI